MRRTLIAALALPLLLAACTGTEELPPNLRLVVADTSGTTLRAYNPETRAQTATRTSDAPVVSLINADAADRVAEVRTTGARFTTSALTPGTDFTAVTPTPCFVRARASAAVDQIGILSACPGETQRLALYRVDGTLIWQATLPPPTQEPANTRFAVTEDSTVTVARPNLQGGSDVLRISKEGTPTTLFTSPAVINDLATLQNAAGTSTLYAATNTDVRVVRTATTPGLSDTVVITGKATRLFTGLRLLAAWNDDTDLLTFWNGTPGTAKAPDRTFPDLRDVTIAPDAYAYVLSGSTVTRLDTQALLSSGSWTPTDIISGLGNAQAITWANPLQDTETP